MGADYIGTVLEFPRKKDEHDFDYNKINWEKGERHIRKMSETQLWNSLICAGLVSADYDVCEADLPEMREEFGDPVELAMEAFKGFKDSLLEGSKWNCFIGYKTFIFTTGEMSWGDSVEEVDNSYFLYRSDTAKAMGFVSFEDWQ